MQVQKLAIKEQIVKRVVKSGNGGAVWVPKDWLGQEVIVILPDKPQLDIKEKIMHLLEPYLKHATAVFIYGSYARNEETKDSDVDVMVITKDKTMHKIKEPNLEINILGLDKLKKVIKKYPVMYYQIVQEAVPLINAYVLDELRNVKINNENFKHYLNDTKEHIQSNKELIELDKLDGVYIKSYSILYSTILRLRGIFVIKCILNKEKFYNKTFEELLIQKGITKQEFKQCYMAYRAVRDDKNINVKIEISVAERLSDILTKEAILIESELYGK